MLEKNVENPSILYRQDVGNGEGKLYVERISHLEWPEAKKAAIMIKSFSVEELKPGRKRGTQ